jgi:hypothetical protein
MNIYDRGMKKWRPFASLPEYKDYYEEMLKKREEILPPVLSEDEEEEINEALISAKRGDPVSLVYFDQGRIYERKDIFVKADGFSKVLFCEDISLPFDKIVALSHN